MPRGTLPKLKKYVFGVKPTMSYPEMIPPSDSNDTKELVVLVARSPTATVISQ